MIKRILTFNDYKNCWFKNEIILKSQRFKREAHCLCNKKVNKLALKSNDDKKCQTFDRIRKYPYGTNAFKVCKIEMLSKYKWLILIITLIKVKQSIIQSGHIFQIIYTR